MHWAVILTLLGLALANAWLVFVVGWGALEASLTVAAISLGVVAIFIAGVSAFTPKKDRAGFLQVVRDTVKRDLKDVARWIGID